MIRQCIAAWVLLTLPVLLPSWAGQAIVTLEQEQWQIGINQNDTTRLSGLLEAHLRAGGKPDVRNRKGKTALMAAAAARDLTLFERLLAAGADPAAVNVKGASTLIYAAWGGDTRILGVLVDQRVPLEQAASNGWTAVMMSAAKGHHWGLELLLAAGAIADSRDVYGWTPLMRASNLGRTAAARSLINAGNAQVNAFNTKGQTPLHLAAAGEHRALYKLLLASGADPDQVDFKGRTAGQIASAVGVN